MAEFIAPDGARLSYADAGAGVAVLALAGLTRDGRDFDYLAPHLKDVRLIRLDYRGRGGSEWTRPATYTIETEAADALALLDHLELDRAAILGVSRGGLIAMHLGETAVDRLSGVCLVDIGPEVPEAAMEVIRAYTGRNPGVDDFETAARLRATLLPGFRDVPMARWRAEAEKHYRMGDEGLTITYDPALGDAVREGGGAPVDFWDGFAALSGLPVALIRGAGSELLPEDMAQKMRARLPDMLYAEVADRGHVPFLDEPEALDVIGRWLERLR